MQGSRLYVHVALSDMQTIQSSYIVKSCTFKINFQTIQKHIGIVCAMVNHLFV
jgi:hypothetical protein